MDDGLNDGVRSSEAEQENVLAMKALDALNDVCSKRNGHFIVPYKTLIRDFGSVKIISFLAKKNGELPALELATILQISENKFADISEYSHHHDFGTGAFNLLKAGEFVRGGFVLVFGSTRMGGCFKLLLIKDGEIIDYDPECDIIGAC